MTSINIPLSNDNSGTYKFITRRNEWLVLSMELNISDSIPERNNVWAIINGTDCNNTEVYIDSENSSNIVIPCRISVNGNSETIFLHLGNVILFIPCFC